MRGDPGETEKQRKEAEETIAAFDEKDPGMKRFFDNAHGYALYPTVGKGGLIVGAAYGSGLVYEKGKLLASPSWYKER